MFLADCHTHSRFSFDAEPAATLDAMCDTAIAAGLNEIAITDHYECEYMLEGFYPMLDLDARQKAILNARDKYKGKLFVTYGIELGQPVFSPTEACELTSKYDFDYVIGSVHTVKGIRDLCYVKFDKYTDHQIVMLWEQYMSEMSEHISLGGFDTVAHITYPWRYIVRNGKQDAFKLSDYKDSFAQIFRLIIENNLSLECNTSGFRQGLGSPMPDFELLKLYRSLGGTMVTTGSDAHYLEHIGSDVRKTASVLSDIGFKYITVYRKRKPYMIKI